MATKTFRVSVSAPMLANWTEPDRLRWKQRHVEQTARFGLFDAVEVEDVRFGRRFHLTMRVTVDEPKPVAAMDFVPQAGRALQFGWYLLAFIYDVHGAEKPGWPPNAVVIPEPVSFSVIEV